jgi:predicted O-methyltransferase YrrM
VLLTSHSNALAAGRPCQVRSSHASVAARAHLTRANRLLQELREETLRLPRASMLLAPEQAQFMALVARLVGVEHYLEVGTFTSYSALAIALALGPSGTTPTRPRSLNAIGTKPASPIALSFVWDRPCQHLMALLAQKKGRIRHGLHRRRQGKSARLLRALHQARPSRRVDLIDNTLWVGSVADTSDQDPATQAIRAFNFAVHADARVDMVLLPIGDSLTLARPRP